jgi:hypothetical protein
MVKGLFGSSDCIQAPGTVIGLPWVTSSVVYQFEESIGMANVTTYTPVHYNENGKTFSGVCPEVVLKMLLRPRILCMLFFHLLLLFIATFTSVFFFPLCNGSGLVRITL